MKRTLGSWISLAICLCLFVGMLASCTVAPVPLPDDGPDATPPDGGTQPPAPTTYTVTFVGGEDATGTAPTEEDKEAGASFALPANTFTKAGCHFTKWSDGTSLYDAGETYTMPAHGVTFTAQWEQDGQNPPPTTGFTVTFNLGEYPATSEQVPATLTGLPSGYIIEALPYPAGTEGWTFNGWETDLPEDYYVHWRNYEVTCDVNFIATWRPANPANDVIVTFADDMGTIQTITVEKYGYILEENVPDAPTKTGHVFMFWSREADGDRIVDFNSVSVNKDTTIYAVYRPEGEQRVEYGIDYETATGIAPANAYVTVGSTYTFPGNPWTVPHYVFAGFKIQRQVEEISSWTGRPVLVWEDIESGVLYQPGDTIEMPDERIRVTIEVTGETITVIYDAGGGTDAPNGSTFTYGEILNVTSSTPTPPTGKEFYCWVLSDGTEVGSSTLGEYGYRDYVTAGNTLTLTATWEALPEPLDIADYAGVWTDGTDTVLISSLHANEEYGYLGSAIINGTDLFILYEDQQELVGYNVITGKSIEVWDGEMITLAGVGFTIRPTSRTAISANAQSTYAGTWSDAEGNVLSVGADTAAYGEEEISLTYVGMEEYAVFCFLGEYGARHTFVLKLDGGTLTGVYFNEEICEATTVIFTLQA